MERGKPVRVLIHLESHLIRFMLLETLAKAKNLYPLLPHQDPEHEAPDIILTDPFSLAPQDDPLVARFKEAKLVLLDYGLNRTALLKFLAHYRISGILSPKMNPELLEKAMTVISAGQIWISNEYILDIMEVMNNPPGKTPLLSLTPREKETVKLLAEGLLNKQIAKRLNVSEQTVKSHLYRIYKKFGVGNRTQLLSLLLNGKLQT